MVPLLVSAIQEVLVIVPLMLSKLADLFNGRSYTCPCARVKFIIYLVHFTILLFLTRYFLRICFSLIILKSELYDNLSSDLPVFCLYLNKRTNLIDQFLFTVVDYRKTEPFLMEIEYENIEGLLTP